MNVWYPKTVITIVLLFISKCCFAQELEFSSTRLQLQDFFDQRFQADVEYTEAERAQLLQLEKDFNAPMAYLNKSAEERTLLFKIQDDSVVEFLRKIEQISPEKYRFGQQMIARKAVSEWMASEGVKGDVTLLSNPRVADSLKLDSTQRKLLSESTKLGNAEKNKLIESQEKEIERSWNAYREDLMSLLPSRSRQKFEKYVGKPFWPLIRVELTKVNQDVSYLTSLAYAKREGRTIDWIQFMPVVTRSVLGPIPDELKPANYDRFTYRVIALVDTAVELGLSEKDQAKLKQELEANQWEFAAGTDRPSEMNLRVLLSKDRKLPEFLLRFLDESKQNRLLEIETQAHLEFSSTFGLLNPVAIELFQVPDSTVEKIIDAEAQFQHRLAELRAKQLVEVRKADSNHIAESMKHLNEEQLAKYRSLFGF